MIAFWLALFLVGYAVTSARRDQRITEIAESLERIEQWLERWEERRTWAE